MARDSGIESMRKRALTWLDGPQARGMGTLGVRLQRANLESHLLRALIHEALLARRLVSKGFAVESELPTPRGKMCDIVARRGATVLHVHVKCLELDEFRLKETKLRIPRALKELESISRRLLVEIDWKSGLNSRRINAMSMSMREFLMRASIGDEFAARDSRGAVIGRCRVRSPRDRRGIALTRGVWVDHHRAVQRVARLLTRAHEQFLPGGENIIVIYGPPGARWIFEQALLGTPSERWDKFPRKGEAVAMGCANDGFWTPGTRETSRVAVWGSLLSPASAHTAWIRPPVTAGVRRACEELFSTVILRDDRLLASSSGG